MSRAGSRLAAVFALAALVSAQVLAQASVDAEIPEKPAKYVTDRAGILGSERVNSLSLELEQFERETSNQILVWVDRKVPERFTLEDFAVRAAEKWKAGQAKTDNGAVLFVFVDDRKLRIEVGYGLEGVIPDATAKQIIDGEIVPRFRSDDYPGGIEAGVNALMAAAKGEYKGSGSTVAERSRKGRNDLSGCIIPGLFILFFIVLPALARQGSRKRRRTFGGSGWWTGMGGGGWSGGGGGWSGGGGGGGGFSGGGGSFGGGGASGSW
ncbi:MAG TPA: TPM domain-containing protein [Thermoanaerobaculia bacterium]|nr:TPM domain-containing protein [Thermoanaerobaculia bacterium]